MPSILIVDDQASIHEMLDTVVQPIGFETSFAVSGSEALEKYRQNPFDIVLTDVRMESMDGLELLAKIKAINPKAIVIMMSGFADTACAMVALKQGAFDFLTKPFKVDQLMAAIKRATLKIREQATAESPADDTHHALAGRSSAIIKLKQAITKLAATSTPILLQGEIGTQKKLIASLIHEASLNEKNEAPFVDVDCKSLSPDQIQSQLLAGPLVEKANGGTLFIGDIDALPRELQAELGEVIRKAKSQTRIICSSGLDLEKKVDESHFDEALFYTISTIPVHIPSLRERSQDIPLLAKSILEQAGFEKPELDERAKAILQGYRWPGNFTELKEAIEAAAQNTDDGKINSDSLPEKIKNVESWPTLAEHIDAATCEYMMSVLQACQGDVENAARILQCEKEKLSELA